jgi:16S rRNA pseudouridine516 synthase
MRLDKYLAEASIGTRKIVRNYVKEGNVTVNNQVVLEPSTEIDEFKDVIQYQGVTVIHTGNVYYMFHKPNGCITARQDLNSKTVLDYFDTEHNKGLFPVGRLDKDTEGLLLLTSDGEFCHRLMHPEKHVEKTYFFWALGAIDENAMERLLNGVSIGEDEDLAKATGLEMKEHGYYKDLKDRLQLIRPKRIKLDPNKQQVVAGLITIDEGRKHQVKRMLKAVGCYVTYLKRVSIGNLVLDETLLPGQYRELTEEEIKEIYY